MMCAISAIDPCQRYFSLVIVTVFDLLGTFFYLSGLFPTRELIIAALDNLSAQLHYPSRFKVLYLFSFLYLFVPGC